MRVAFAVATAFTPDLLLVDEALAVGDISFQAKCFDRIQALRARARAMLFVSHSVEEVVRHCDRALFVDEGRLRMDAASTDVANAYLDHVWGKGRSRGRASASRYRRACRIRTSRSNSPPGPTTRKEEYHSGEGGARLLDYPSSRRAWFFPALINAGQDLRIVMRVAFDRDVHSRSMTCSLRRTTACFSSNQLRMALPGPAAVRDRGSVANVCEFVLPLGLNSGAFLISLGVCRRTRARGSSLRSMNITFHPVAGTQQEAALGNRRHGRQCRILESAPDGRD